MTDFFDNRRDPFPEISIRDLRPKLYPSDDPAGFTVCPECGHAFTPRDGDDCCSFCGAKARRETRFWRWRRYLEITFYLGAIAAVLAGLIYMQNR